MQKIIDKYNKKLATFSSNDINFRGRVYKVKKSKYRTEYQRDRDRVIHCNSFRRLKHKTQVFVYHEGDHFRTRLTHSIEVSQISRSIARVLGLNEDLCETLSLAHDLGHTPFGHAGEGALNKCMTNNGGFDHNLQTIRILIFLERVYQKHTGLNLTINTIDGLIKHNGVVNNYKLIEKSLPEIKKYKINYMDIGSLEAQISSISDDIAYNCHDIDDGLRAGLFKLEDLKRITSFNNAIEKNKISLNNYGINRFLINYLVTDLIEETNKRIKKSKIKTIKDVYKYGKNLVSFSKKTEFFLKEIRNFLKGNMYSHKFITKWNIKSEDIVEQLFNYYLKNYDKIKEKHESQSKERNICDFIAGMTDKYALTIYNDLIK